MRQVVTNLATIVQHGRTLLHEALVNGDATTVKTLIVAGAMLIDPVGHTRVLAIARIASI